jgi:hypothetical protein
MNDAEGNQSTSNVKVVQAIIHKVLEYRGLRRYDLESGDEKECSSCAPLLLKDAPFGHTSWVCRPLMVQW